LWVGARMGRTEWQMGVEPERAVRVDLRHTPQLRVVVAEAEFHVVVAVFARDEPGKVVLDLIIRVPRSLRLGARLRQKTDVVELRRAQGLIATRLLPEHEPFPAALGSLRAETLVAVPPMLPRSRHA